MSARYLPRQLGVIMSCNVDGCTEQLRTAVIVKKSNRAYAKTQGWIRGGLPGKKRWDICPTHAPAHLEEVAAAKKAKDERIAARREAKRLRWATREQQQAAKAAKRAARKSAAAQEASVSP